MDHRVHTDLVAAARPANTAKIVAVPPIIDAHARPAGFHVDWDPDGMTGRSLLIGQLET